MSPIIAGIKIHDTRMLRLMEVLLHGGTQLSGWRSADTSAFAVEPAKIPCWLTFTAGLASEAHTIKTTAILRPAGAFIA